MNELSRILEQQSGASFWHGIPWVPTLGSDFLAVLFSSAIKFGAVVLPVYFLFQFCERKLSADLQARVGPDQAGFHGALQVIADSIKLIAKRRDRENRKGLRPRAILFAGFLMALFSSLSVLPIGGLVTHEGTELTLFLPFWLSTVCCLLVLWIGLESNGVTGWLSSLRMASQFLAGLVPTFLSVLAVIIRAGTFRLSEAVASQAGGIGSWGIFADPLQPAALSVYLLGSMMMAGCAPMDAAIVMGDLSGGVANFAAGRHQQLLRIARFYAMFFWSSLGVALFLGGWNLPEGVTRALVESDSWGLLGIAEIVVVFLKTFLLMIGMALVSRVVPRPRVDLVSEISWKILTPTALLVLILGALWKGMIT